MAFVARSKWHQDQRDIALAGGKPSDKEPDWGLGLSLQPKQTEDPLEKMSPAELRAHFDAIKKSGRGQRKSIAEMRATGTLKGVAE